jgi:hypothetical protein
MHLIDTAAGSDRKRKRVGAGSEAAILAAVDYSLNQHSNKAANAPQRVMDMLVFLGLSGMQDVQAALDKSKWRKATLAARLPTGSRGWRERRGRSSEQRRSTGWAS